MQASIVIPVWNGASVVRQCLDALHAHSGEELFEVICVDNASHDESAELIARHFPRVRLVRQPVNLGFAGGVNAGIEAAEGDLFVLLNQDCLVEPDWLIELTRALEEHSEFGIAGCTVLNADGTVNHAGAMIHRPDVRGMHLTEIVDKRPKKVEYVTGTALVIRRQTWDAVGRFDEGYHPAYFEDADYCYRARRKGIEVGYVPDARVKHLFSNKAWRADTVLHLANHEICRYRFVIKHLNSTEVSDFFKAEYTAIETEHYLDHAIARVIAARGTLRNMADILERRWSDLGDVTPPAHRRQLQMGFTQIMRQSFSCAEKLALPQPVGFASELSIAGQTDDQYLESLRQKENDILTQIYFRDPLDESPESTPRRIFRLRVLRLLSILSGRDYFLQSKLTATHRARVDRFEERMERRLKLLEMLTAYDYR